MNTDVIARLRPGISLRQAGTEMATFTEGLRQLLAEEIGRMDDGDGTHGTGSGVGGGGPLCRMRLTRAPTGPESV